VKLVTYSTFFLLENKLRYYCISVNLSHRNLVLMFDIFDYSVTDETFQLHSVYNSKALGRISRTITAIYPFYITAVNFSIYLQDLATGM